VFEPDRFITGERLSYFDPSLPALVGRVSRDMPLQTLAPRRTFQNSELAGRLYRTIGSYEVALYGYLGFTKQPTAFDAHQGLPTFAPLHVFGASIRGSGLGGITYLEGAYYVAPDDRDGTDPLVPNEQVRVLVGHERELIPRLTWGVQYYLEWIQDHAALRAQSFWPTFEPSEYRHMVTSRFTYRLLQETLTLSLFGFASPNDGDVHLRPTLSRKWSDAVTISAGANLMWGDEHTFFGQLQNNSNIYARVRYGF
jgi:hypothetical protein